MNLKLSLCGSYCFDDVLVNFNAKTSTSSLLTIQNILHNGFLLKNTVLHPAFGIFEDGCIKNQRLYGDQ